MPLCSHSRGALEDFMMESRKVRRSRATTGRALQDTAVVGDGWVAAKMEWHQHTHTTCQAVQHTASAEVTHTATLKAVSVVAAPVWKEAQSDRPIFVTTAPDTDAVKETCNATKRKLHGGNLYPLFNESVPCPFPSADQGVGRDQAHATAALRASISRAQAAMVRQGIVWIHTSLFLDDASSATPSSRWGGVRKPSVAQMCLAPPASC
jgi:hypothetical protein